MKQGMDQGMEQEMKQGLQRCLAGYEMLNEWV